MAETLTFDQLPSAVSELMTKLDKIERLLLDAKEKTSTQQQDELLTIDQAAILLNIKNPTIYSLVSRGELPVMKRSKRLYFSKLELINYLKQGRKKTNSEIETEATHFLNRKPGRA